MSYTTTSHGLSTIYGTSMGSQARIPAARGNNWVVLVQVAYYNAPTGTYSYSSWYSPTQIITNVPGYYRNSPLATCKS